MQAAVLGIPDDDVDRLEPYRQTRTEDGHDLTDQIDVTGVARTADGLDITEGRAAREYLERAESVSLSHDAIAVGNEPRVAVDHARFAIVPGEIVAVERTKGLFLYDLLERATGITTTRARIDLSGVRATFPDASIWKLGFYGRETGAENGTLHGEDLQDDPAVADHLTDTSLNQLGLRVTWEGTDYNLTITESGYVQIYEPRGMKTSAFLGFLSKHIQPHIQPDT